MRPLQSTRDAEAGLTVASELGRFAPLSINAPKERRRKTRCRGNGPQFGSTRLPLSVSQKRVS